MKYLNKFMWLLGILITLSCSKNSAEQPDLPQLEIFDRSVTETNADQVVDINVELLSTSSSAVTVNYKTNPITAESDVDYVSVAQGTLTFNPGETQKSIPITIKGDQIVESTETFEVELFNPQGAALFRSKATVTINDDDHAPLVIPSGGYSTPNSYNGYTLAWADEFKANKLDSLAWNFEIGNGSNGWGNNELEYYRSGNTYIAESEYLVIEAKKETFSGFNYTSSRITTQNKKKFTYGRIDIRALLPTGKGIWPALWMLGSNINSVGWPACGEVDIMEIIGSAPNKLVGTAHWDNQGQYASYSGDTTLGSGIFADQFHVFSITWDNQFIRWYLDDVQYHVIDITPVDLNEFQKDFFLIFNVAVGGNWPGSPDNSTVFPQRMIVDYIRVFQKS